MMMPPRPAARPMTRGSFCSTHEEIWLPTSWLGQTPWEWFIRCTGNAYLDGTYIGAELSVTAGRPVEEVLLHLVTLACWERGRGAGQLAICLVTGVRIVVR